MIRTLALIAAVCFGLVALLEGWTTHYDPYSVEWLFNRAERDFWCAVVLIVLAIGGDGD